MEPPTPRRPAALLALGLLVAVLAYLHLERGRRWNEYHTDESSYVAQAYFADAMLRGARDDAIWLSFPATDQPPVAKVAFGLALIAGGQPRPKPEDAVSWHEDNNLVVGTPLMRHVARGVAVGFGALGCLALFALGTLAGGARLGAIAGVLLAVNPLYAQQARRALADVPAEALSLAALAFLLFAWRRALSTSTAAPPPRRWVTVGAAMAGGVVAGVAVGTKLTALVVPLVVAAWVALAAGRRGVPAGRRAGVAIGAVLAGLLGFATLLAINPTLTARPRPQAVALLPESSRAYAPLGPVGRLLGVIRQRARISGVQQRVYPHYALLRPAERLGIAAVQGFGRFSPLGARYSNVSVRYDRAQDWPVVLWLPLCALGAFAMAREGRRQRDRGEPPAAWAALALVGVTIGTVVAYLPMAWDRYLLPIQPPAALLAAAAIGAGIDRARGARARPRPAGAAAAPTHANPGDLDGERRRNRRIPGRQAGP
jgi:4-amino-4-deoxy-L-arabinose transferase-like glycosyltransferase